ncbi:MAG: Rcat domain-containing protein [bacterium]
MKGQNFKQCYNCKFWVEKTEGCDHMTCKCGAEFCYICGGEYGACSCDYGSEGQQEDELSVYGLEDPLH